MHPWCTECPCVLIYVKENTTHQQQRLHSFIYSGGLAHWLNGTLVTLVLYCFWPGWRYCFLTLVSVLVPGRATRSLLLTVSGHNFQMLFQPDISAHLFDQVLGQENKDTFNNSVLFELGCPCYPSTFGGSVYEQKQEAFFLSSPQNVLTENTFCVTHVHVFRANLYFILMKNSVQGLFHVQRVLLMAIHSWRTLWL